MNCMLIEDGNEAIVIDCGVLFSGLNHFGAEFIIPNFEYLLARKSKIRRVILIHGYEDHIGAIPFILRLGIKAPIYVSHFTGRLLSEKLKKHSLPHRVDMRAFCPGEQLTIGKFEIKTVPVNHSIVESPALIMETPLGRIVHTGDFKIDPTPFCESTIDLKCFEQAGDKGVLLLLSDSTNDESPQRVLCIRILKFADGGLDCSDGAKYG